MGNRSRDAEEGYSAEQIVTKQVRAVIAKYFIVLIGVVLFAAVAPAQSPYATSYDSFAWDYPDRWIADFNVVRFEIRIDGWAPSGAGMLALSRVPESYFAPLPALPTGQHLVEVRACNVGVCGAWSSPLLFYFMGVFPPPGVVLPQ